jgi:hypothetical protein
MKTTVSLADVLAQDCIRCGMAAGRRCSGVATFCAERVAMARHAKELASANALDFEATITTRTYVDGLDVTDALREKFDGDQR